MDDSLLTPHKSYISIYRNKHKENATEYFDNLVKRSNINIEENRKTIKEINAQNEILKNVNKQLNKNKSLKSILFASCISLPIIYIILCITLKKVLFYILGGVCLGALIVWFILLIKKLKNKINNFETEKNKLEQKIKELTALSWAQMKALNSLYDWNIAGEIMMQTVPLIKLDKNFDNNKFYELKEKYAFDDSTNLDESTIFVQSGSILGYPFIIRKTFNTKMGLKTYQGSIVIHWTTTSRDSKGNVRTVHHSQTLVATVDKPCPMYNYNTNLIYANDAAPNLTFSRMTTDYENKSSKQIEKIINKETKKLNKKSEKAIMNNDNYTRFGNDKFEVLFGGTDRNNELEYRLLFTPLAQTNMIELILDKDPYGDDFDFIKDKKLNIIHTEHAQKFEYNINPNVFASNDYDKAKENFININSKYFESLFFDLAPVLSIPLYQQTKSQDYIYGKEYKSNVTSYEHETMANTFNIDDLKNPLTNSSVILKTKLLEKDGTRDKVNITAYSYKTIERVDVVNKLGGDGKFHAVPVHWLEYIPIEQENIMEIENVNTDRLNYSSTSSLDNFRETMRKYAKNNNYNYQRGIFSVLVNRFMDSNDYNNLSKDMNKNEGDSRNKTILDDINKIKEIIENKGE